MGFGQKSTKNAKNDHFDKSLKKTEVLVKQCCQTGQL